MFMDPSAFEAEEIERELADAGLGIENANSSSARPRAADVSDDVPPRSAGAAALVGGASTGLKGGPAVNSATSTIPPSSGSSYGFRTGSSTTSSHHSSEAAVPRAMAKNGRQHTPTYGRHSNKGAGSRSSKSRAPIAPPSSTPPGSFVEIPAGRGNGWDGDGTFSEDSGAVDGMGASGGSGSGGVSSRARVLAQQREIERKRRQQRLRAGRIRASDAASLSRGVASPSSKPGVVPTQRRSTSGDQATARGPGGADSVGGDLEESSYGFSPSVKQFSAPRQVENGEYTTFSPNLKPGKEQKLSLSEFDRRRSSGFVYVPDDVDSGDDDSSRRRRRERHAPADPGFRALDDDKSETDTTASPGTFDGHGDDQNRRRRSGRVKSERPADWDDRHRPPSKAYKWGQDREEVGSGVSSESSAWRSIGRAYSPRDGDLGHDTDPRRRWNSEASSKSRSRPKPIKRQQHSDDEGDNEDEDVDTEERSSDSIRRSNRDRSSDCSDDHPPSGSSRRRNDVTSSRRHQSSSSKHKQGGSKHTASSRIGGDRGTGGRNRDSEGDSDASEDDRYRDKGRRFRGRHGNDGDEGGEDGDENGSQGSEDESRRSRHSDSHRRHHRHHHHHHRNRRSSDSNDSTNHGRRRRDSSANLSKNTSHHADNDRSDVDDSGTHGRSAHYSKGKSRNHIITSQGSGKGSGGRYVDSDDEQGRDDQDYDGRAEQRDGSDERAADDEAKSQKNPSDRDDRDRSGARRGSGAGGEGDDPNGNVAPRDGAYGKGAANIGNTGSGAIDEGNMEFNMNAIDLSDMKRFLMSPCPRGAGVVQCYIRRNKTRANKLFPEYTLFMKEGDRFLMCSKKRPNNATSNYLVSMRAGDLDRNSRNFLGKLRANFVGTEFQVFDDGYNPREPGTFGLSKTLGGGNGGGSSASSNVDDPTRPMRKELGCVLYASNVLGSRGPRKMQVAIPAVSDDGTVTEWSELDGGNASHHNTSNNHSKAIERIKNRDYDGSLYMVNKPPRWNDQVGAYVLNFYGRVTMASVKNFQLVSTEDFDRIILQFGRVAKDEFTMDFQYPISPFQAFAITLSSFDSKIACD